MKQKLLAIIALAIISVPLGLAISEQSGAYLILYVVPGIPILCVIGVWYEGRTDNDANKEVYDTVLDMFKSYADDWTWEDITAKKNRVVGRRYHLHDNVEIVRDLREESSAPPIQIWITDPVTSSQVKYVPNSGYRHEFIEYINQLHKYHELKAVVNVALHADANRSSLDKARETLEQYRIEKEIKDS